MMKPVHLTDTRQFKRAWNQLGGDVLAISGTGEVRYVHTYFVDTVRANDRRKDVPAVLISRLNQLIRRNAANDPK